MDLEPRTYTLCRPWCFGYFCTVANRLHDLDALRSVLEASWDERTSYQGAMRGGNPAFGQCYPTAWLVQQFDPRMEIIRGTVEADDELHTHFWNALPTAQGLEHLDLTWQQFSAGARIRDFQLLRREDLGDSPETVARCQLLMCRVRAATTSQPPGTGSHRQGGQAALTAMPRVGRLPEPSPASR